MNETVRLLMNNYHLTGRVGGWIYRSDGTHICQGWDEFTRMINQRGIIIRQHPFIDWGRADEFLNPRGVVVDE